MAKLVAESAFDFKSVKEGNGNFQFGGGGEYITASFSTGMIYKLSAAPGSSMSYGEDGPIGIVGEWAATQKDKAYYTLSGIAYDINASYVYDTGYTDGGITVKKMAAELAVNMQGNDEVLGSRFNDKLAGFAGNDLLNGGQGKDFLTGGTGADTFQFTEFGSRHVDTVTDFVRGIDKIQLDAAVFTRLPDTLTADMLVVGKKAKATDAADRLLFDTGSGTLSYDADGNGKGKAEMIAKLTGIKDFAITDILLVDAIN